MKICHNCKIQLTDSTKFCPKCGAPLPDSQIIDYTPPRQPKKSNSNSLLISICAVAGGIIIALILYIFLGRDNKPRVYDEEDVEELVENETKSNKYEWLSERLVTASDLEGKSAGDLRLMRNAIFARHGYIFKSDDLKEYFSRFDWYEPRYKDVSNRLSGIEQKNIAYIQRFEGNASASSSQSTARLQNIGMTDDYSDIVCYVKLSESDLQGLSKSELRILRNTIYARHGRKFKSKDLDRYFNSFAWYNGIYDEIPSNWLSDIEKHNITLIQRFE